MIQILLRATPDDLPELLIGLGLAEQPVIDDDPDPVIGLSWDLPNKGIEISFDEGRVSTVFLYGPFGIEWATSYDDALNALGSPSRHSGGGDADGPLGALPPWVRYDDDDHCVHIQFIPDKSRIAMVSVMTPERAP